MQARIEGGLGDKLKEQRAMTTTAMTTTSREMSSGDVASVVSQLARMSSALEDGGQSPHHIMSFPVF
jgi:hypothetical protein